MIKNFKKATVMAKVFYITCIIAAIDIVATIGIFFFDMTFTNPTLNLLIDIGTDLFLVLVFGMIALLCGGFIIGFKENFKRK